MEALIFIVGVNVFYLYKVSVLKFQFQLRGSLVYFLGLQMCFTASEEVFCILELL